jgi:predicted ATPase
MVGSSTRDSPFVGRQEEMAELTHVMDEAISGRGRIVMLMGEPGIGKTRIAQELAAMAEGRGVQALWGRCYEGVGMPPYWPWLQLLRSHIHKADAEQLRREMGAGASDIAEILPELGQKLPGLTLPPALDSPEQARFRLFDSITTFLKNASGAQPLMLVLDDLHWADRPSLLLLEFMAREVGQSGLMVVCAYRDVELSRQHPLSETLARLSRESAFQRVLLRGLAQEHVGQFIAASAGVTPTQELVDSVYTQTEGNPFFMIEVIRLVSDEGGLAEDRIGGVGMARLPEGVREVVGQRLNRLSGLCNHVLTTASVIGREFDFRLLRLLYQDSSEEALLSALDEALEARVIEEAEGQERYQFSHALIGQTLAGELSSSRRVRLHARIGEALEGIYAANVEAHAAELVLSQHSYEG